MRLWYAKLMQRKTNKIRWVRVRRDGGLNPHDKTIYRLDKVPEWLEIEATSTKVALEALEKGEGIICTPSTVGPSRSRFTKRAPTEEGADDHWRPDDSDVPVVESTLYADGWRSETITVDMRVVDVIVAPDGTRYIEAAYNANADLIVDHTKSKNPHLGRLRYRLYENSKTAKDKAKEEKAAQKRAEAKAKEKAKKKTTKRKTTKRKTTKRKKTAH